MGFTAYDTFKDEIVQIDQIPYKVNDAFSYKKRRAQNRYVCLSCGIVVSEIDPFVGTTKSRLQYDVKRHFRCNNKECNKEFKDKKRYNICKKGQTVAEVKAVHDKFVSNWLRYFNYKLVHLEEGIKIPDKKIILLFSHCIITFEIVKKLIRENHNYKIIVVFDEDAKIRNLTQDPDYKEDSNGNGYYSIYLPKKNDIQYCLENNFEVYLDTQADTLLELKENGELGDTFNCKLVDINDFTFRTGIYNHQTKPIVRKDYNDKHLFELAYFRYQKLKQDEIDQKIKDNERQAWINARK
jgi:hypothetical protein